MQGLVARVPKRPQLVKEGADEGDEADEELDEVPACRPPVADGLARTGATTRVPTAILPTVWPWGRPIINVW